MFMNSGTGINQGKVEFLYLQGAWASSRNGGSLPHLRLKHQWSGVNRLGFSLGDTGIFHSKIQHSYA